MNNVILYILFIIFIFICILFMNSIHSKNNTEMIQVTKPYWKTCKTISDGSCFYHAVLNCISASYRNNTICSKTKLSKQFRESLESFCTYSLWKTQFSNIISYKRLIYNIRYEWAGHIEWILTELYLDIRLIIIRDNTQSIYYYNEDISRSHKKIIILINTNDNHYEPLKYVYNDTNDKYIFRYSPLIKKLINKYTKK